MSLIEWSLKRKKVFIEVRDEDSADLHEIKSARLQHEFE